MTRTAEPAPPPTPPPADATPPAATPPAATPTPAPSQSPEPAKTRKRPFGRRHPVLKRLFATLVVLLVLLVLLVGGALVAVTFVLRSSYPKSIAQSVASKQLGLDVQIGSVDVPWFGPTVVRDLAVSLPLAGEPFLKVPLAYATHPNLLWLAAEFLITGDPPIDVVGVRDPVVDAIQDADGEWNVLRAVAAVQAAQARPDAPKSNSLPPIPAIKLVGGTVNIVSNAGPAAGRPREAVAVEGLEVNGEPQGLRYAFAAGVPGRAVARGRVVTGGNFAHEVSVTATDVTSYVRPFLAAAPENLAFLGRWSGAVSGGALSGRLTIDHAAYAALSAQGFLDATAAGESATLRLRDLRLALGDAMPDGVHVTAGTVEAGPTAVTATGVRAGLLEGVVDVTSATYSLQGSESGEASVAYRGVRPAGDAASLDGTIEASFAAAPTGGYTVSVRQSGVATAEQGTATTELAVDGGGPELTNLELTAVLKKLHIRTTPAEGEPMERVAPEVTAKLEVQFDDEAGRVGLTSLSVDADPGALTGRGEYVLSRDEEPVDAGYLAVTAARLPLDVPRLEGVRVTIDAGLDAWVARQVPPSGGPEAMRVTVKKAYALTDGVWLQGGGTYSAADPEPVRFEAVASRSPGSGGNDPLADLLAGTAYATVTGGGTTDPLDLKVRVDVSARDLTVLDKYTLKEFDAALVGDADGERVTLRSESPIEVLDGTATLAATNPYSGKRPITAELAVDGVSLADAGDLVGVDGLRGRARGTVRAQARSLSPDKVEAVADFEVPDFEFDPARVAERVTLHAELQNGVATVAPLVLETKDRDGEPGSLKVRTKLDLADLDNATLALTFDNYAAALRQFPVDVVVKGGTPSGKPLSVHLGGGNPSIDGKVGLDVDVNLLDFLQVARLNVKASAEGRALVIDEANVGTKFGGEITADGRLDLDRPEEARLTVDWQDVDLGRIGDFAEQAVPGATGLAGTVTGELLVGPSGSEEVRTAIEQMRAGDLIDPAGIGRGRPLGPVAVVLSNRTDGGRWREVSIGGLGMVAFADLAADSGDLAEGAGRTATTTRPAFEARTRADEVAAAVGAGRPAYGLGQFITRSFRVQVAGGTVSPFLNVSLRPGRRTARSTTDRAADAYFAQANVAFEGLEIGEVVKSVAPEQDRVRGLLAGQVTARGSLEQLTQFAGLQALKTFSGSGRVDLSKAELKGLGAVDKLVGGAKEKADPKDVEAADARAGEGRGRGTVRFRVENDALTVQDLSLLVQGIEIRGAPKVTELSQLPESPLGGFVIATARPLADTKLPFFGGADEVLTALQSSVTAFKLKGTLANLGPDSIEPASLAELGGTLKDILGGGDRAAPK